MAGFRYKAQYTSLNGWEYRLKIWDKNWSGSVTDFDLASDGAVINYNSNGDKKFTEILVSTLEFGFVVSNTAEQAFMTYLRSQTIQEKDIYCVLEKNNNPSNQAPTYIPVWSGIMLFDLGKTEDVSYPYITKLKCIDGLSLLKEIDFVPTPTRNPYNYNQTYLFNDNNYNSNNYVPFIHWIQTILSKVDFGGTTQGIADWKISSSVNWYNDIHSAYGAAFTGQDPLRVTRCNGEQFYKAIEADEADNTQKVRYEAVNCFEALNSICKAWGLRCIWWEQKVYFIQLGNYDISESGTITNPENIRTKIYNNDGTLSSVEDNVGNIGLSRYQQTIENTTAAGEGIQKLATTTWGDYPVIKVVQSNFESVTNINYFQSLPLIYGTTDTPQAWLSPGDVKLTSQTIGTFTDAKDLDGWYINIKVLGINTSSSLKKQSYFYTVRAKPSSQTDWEATTNNQALVAVWEGQGTNQNPMQSYWEPYKTLAAQNPLSPRFTTASTGSLGGSVYNLFTTTQWVPPGNHILTVSDDAKIGIVSNNILNTHPNFIGDWDFEFYSLVGLENSTSPSALLRGHGATQYTNQSFRFSPHSNINGYGFSVNYNNVANAIYGNTFSPIQGGFIGSQSALTSLTTATSDSFKYNITGLLWGDTSTKGVPGSLQCYNGTNWFFTNFSGLWGVGTTSGTDSFTELLCRQVLSSQSSPSEKGNYTLATGQTNKNYNNISYYPKLVNPIGRIKDSYNNNNYIFLRGKFNTLTDETSGMFFEWNYSLASGTGTSTGGGGGGAVIKSVGATNYKSSSSSVNSVINNIFQPIANIKGQYVSGTSYTSIEVENALDINLKTGNRIELSSNGETQAVIVSTDYSAENPTTISIESVTFSIDITEGSEILINQKNLFEQYQIKTEGKVAGFDISSSSITKDSIGITTWLNSDTMTGALATNVPTALSVKNYVDGQAGHDETLQQVTDNGNTTTNDIIGASLTLGDGTTSESAKVFYSDGSYTKILGYGIEMSRVSSYIRPTSTNTTDLYIGNQTLSFSQLEMNATIHKFANGTAEKMRITSTGNVGIGTTSPLQKLSVNGVINSDTNDDYYGAWMSGNSAAGQDSYFAAGTWYSNAGYFKFIQSGTPHRLSIYTYNTADHLTLQEAGGNVGIGTTSPTEKLHVVGDALITGDSMADAFKPAATGESIKFKNFASTEVGRFTDGGNFLVNTATDSGFKLDVFGTLAVSDLPFNTDSVSVLVADETIGSELVTCGDFECSPNTVWNKGTGWTISEGTANAVSATSTPITQTISGFTAGNIYKVSFEVTSVTNGYVRVYAYVGASGTFTNIFESPQEKTGIYEGVFEFGGTNKLLRFYGSSAASVGGFAGSIDNVSVKQVTSASNQIQKRELGTGAFGPTPVGAFLPLTGGTLTGALTGTSATFSGDLNVQNSKIQITATAPEILFSVPNAVVDSRIFNDGVGNFIIGHGTNSATPTERFRITSGGNLLLGTTTDSGDKLNINGSLAVSDISFNTDSVSVLVADETIGAELVTNGDFANGTTGWSTGNSGVLSVVDGALVVTGDGGSYASAKQIVTGVVGETYKLSGKVAVVSGSYNVRVETDQPSWLNLFTTSSTNFVNFEVSFVCVNTSIDLRFTIFNSTVTSSDKIKINDISFKQVTSASNQIQKRELGTGAFGPTPVGAYLPLTGGTLTGSLTGTTATFSGASSGDVYFSGGTEDLRFLQFSTFDTISTNAGHKLDATSGNGQFAFAIGGSEKMRLTSGGNVLINSTTDDGAKLQVTGNATFSSDITTNGDIILNNVTGDPYIKFKTAAQEYVIRIDQSDSEKFQIRDTTNSLTRITLDTSGNVGIGTSNPQRVVHIEDDSVAAIQLENTSEADSFIDFMNPSRNFRVGYDDSTDLFKIAVTNFNSNALVVNSSGNVGINETSPLVPLHISRDSASGENIALLLDNNNTTVGNEIGILFRSMAGSDNTDFEITGKANAANDMDLVFESDGSSERVRFTSDGRVGIGTTAPISTLDVNGSISLSGETENKLYRATTSPANGTVTNTTVLLGRQIDLYALDDIVLRTGTSSNDDIIFFAGNSEKARMKGNGNLLIGTTTDSGAKLQVAGTTTYNSDTVQAFRVSDSTTTSKGIHIGFDATLDKGIIQAGNFGVAYKDLLLNPNLGNVGIGTTSPTTKMTISASNSGAANNNTLRFVDTDVTTQANQSFGKIEFETKDANNAGVNAFINAFSEGTGGTGALSFGTGTSGATEKVRFTSDGNVGIGTSSPGAKVHISEDSANQLYLERTGSITGKYRIGIAGANNRFYISDIAQSSDRFVINEGGQITLPAYGSGTFTGAETYFLAVTSGGDVVEADSSALPGGPYLPLAGGTLTGALEIESISPTLLFDETDVTANWRNRVSGGSYRLQYASDGTTFTDYLVIGANTQLWKVGGTELMRLDATGLGIGESTPNCKLDVKGSVNTTIIAATTLGDGGGALNRGLALRTDTDGGELTTVGTGTNMYLNTANNIYLQNANNTKVTMLANGNVLINSTSDDGVSKLQVNGNVRITGSFQILNTGGYLLQDTGGSMRYGLKYGVAGAVGSSNLLMLTNRSVSSATGGGEVAIAANSSTTGMTEVEVVRIKAVTQSEVSIDGVLSLTAQQVPADPPNNKSVIWMDATTGDLKVKITFTNETVTRTLVDFD